MYIYIYIYVYIYIYIYTYCVYISYSFCSRPRVRRFSRALRDAQLTRRGVRIRLDTHRAHISQFELLELILLLN